MNPLDTFYIRCPSCGQSNRIPSERSEERASCGRCHHELPMVPYEERVSKSHQAAPKIAIIGTEGSGKTVLITTLAKRFCYSSESSIFLDPVDNGTLRFVERNWQTLCSGEWPAGSPLGTMHDLRWRLLLTGDSPFECDLRIVDSAGQDLRRLFSDDEPSSAANLPSHLQNLEAYCRSAEIVICLINLGDFLGESDPERRLDNQIVIKSALQRLAADPSRRLCLLFTQADRYPSILTQEGELPRVVEQVLPYVRGAQLAKGQKQVILRMVASVNKSVVTVSTDGRPRRVPAPDFESFGFDGLMGWLVKEVRAIAVMQKAVSARQAAIQQSIRVTELQREHQKEKAIAAATTRGSVARNIIIVFLGVVVVCWLFFLFGGCSQGIDGDSRGKAQWITDSDTNTSSDERSSGSYSHVAQISLSVEN